MEAKRILSFLTELMANNNREWFLEHKAEYDDVRASFEQGVALAIARIATFDPSVAHLTVKDATYRFYRDNPFSKGQSPYRELILAPTSPHMARRRFTAAITYTSNRATAR